MIEILGLAITYLAIGAGAWFLGLYLVRVFNGERTFVHRALRPVESGIYRVTGIREDSEQTWKGYLVAMLLVTVVSLLFTYVILRIQGALPLNPQGAPGVAPDLAMNTAISFTSVERRVMKPLMTA